MDSDIPLSARVSGTRPIGNSKKTVNEEGSLRELRIVLLMEAAINWKETRSFLFPISYFQFNLYRKESRLGKSLLRST